MLECWLCKGVGSLACETCKLVQACSDSHLDAHYTKIGKDVLCRPIRYSVQSQKKAFCVDKNFIKKVH